MEYNEWCSLPVNWYEKDDTIVPKDMIIRERSRVALISKDDSASKVLMRMANVPWADKTKNHKSSDVNARLQGAVFHGEKICDNAQQVQLVPDDIVCYTNLTVGQFLRGMAMAAKDSALVEQRAVQYLEHFGLDVSEPLMDMTFEQNRLVAMIQAMMYAPAMLLLDRPYDMIGDVMYRKLCEQWALHYMAGNSIVMASESYERIGISCNEYYYMKDDAVVAHFNRKEIPKLPKVVTLYGGEWTPLEAGTLKVLAKQRGRITVLYQAMDGKELLARIADTNCRDFTVEAVSMEEYIYEDYARWTR